MTLPVYIGLVHYPIYNKNEAIITTAITNFDIHDIARTARTYDVKKYFIINPLESQQALVHEMTDYWQTGYGEQYNPDRKEAFSIVSVISEINNAVDFIEEKEGKKPIIVTTDARRFENSISYLDLRKTISTGEKPCLLLFGTGWGIEKNMMKSFDYILDPILGPCEYNHLPVRAAVAIILDRLLGVNI